MQDNSGYDIPSPQDAENQQNEQLAQMARFSPQQAGFQYGSNAMAGNPAIQHAKKVQEWRRSQRRARPPMAPSRDGWARKAAAYKMKTKTLQNL